MKKSDRRYIELLKDSELTLVYAIAADVFQTNAAFVFQTRLLFGDFYFYYDNPPKEVKEVFHNIIKGHPLEESSFGGKSFLYAKGKK